MDNNRTLHNSNVYTTLYELISQVFRIKKIQKKINSADNSLNHDGVICLATNLEVLMWNSH